ASLAHHLVQLAARLPVFLAARPALEVENLHLLEPADHHDPRRAVAWTELELRHLGRAARIRARNCPAVANPDRTEACRKRSLAIRQHLPDCALCGVRVDLLPRTEPGDRYVDPGANRIGYGVFRQCFTGTLGDSGDCNRRALSAEELVRPQRQSVYPGAVLCASRGVGCAGDRTPVCCPDRRSAVHLYEILNAEDDTSAGYLRGTHPAAAHGACAEELRLARSARYPSGVGSARS